MKGWSVATWLDILKRIRAQFHEASQRGTAPRVCWFRLRFPQEIAFRDATKTAERLLLQLGTNAKVGWFLVQEGDGSRRWWCAVVDYDAGDLSFFKELADQSFSAAQWGLVHAVGDVQTLMTDWPMDGYISEDDTKYLNWVCAAANIRRFRPDPMLALTHFWGGKYADTEYDAGGHSSWGNSHGPYHCELSYNFPIDLVSEFDRLDTAQIMTSWDGPFVKGCLCRHDLWRFSVAALDHLIEAAQAPPAATTANDTRDKWLYEQCCKLTKHQSIINQLAKRAEWASITSPQGIKKAAMRYATRHKLPSIPSRQPGRPEKKK